MNLIDILKTKNISDDVIQAIQEEMKANNIFTTSHENMDVRYPKMKGQFETQGQQLKEAQDLIAEMEKATKDQADMQQKVANYEARIAALQTELEDTQIDSDVHVGLLAAGAKPEDIDYIMFKLKAKGKLERGDDGKVKDLNDKIDAMKTQLPGHFTDKTKKTVQEFKLPSNTNNDGGAEPKDLAEALQLQYENKQ